MGKINFWMLSFKNICVTRVGRKGRRGKMVMMTCKCFQALNSENPREGSGGKQGVCGIDEKGEERRIERNRNIQKTCF